MAAATIALAHERVEETLRVVEGGLVAFNDAAAGPHNSRPLTLSVRRAGAGAGVYVGHGVRGIAPGRTSTVAL